MDFTQADRKFVFEHDGKTWELPRVNARDVKLPYARFRQEKRKDFILGHFDTRMPQEYRIAMEVFQAGADDGTYAWRSDAFFKSLRDDENVTRLLWLWFRMVDPKIGEDFIGQLWAERREDLDRLLGEMLNEANPLFLPGANGHLRQPSQPSSPAPLSAPEVATKS